MTGPADPTLAAHWFQRAAAAGSPQGHLELGLALAKGAGVPKEPYWAAWRLGRALTLPGLTPQEKELAEKTAKDAAAVLTPAERAAVAANLAGKAAP
jgi:TPR repeat protein